MIPRQDDQRAIEDPELVESVEQATGLVVRVGQVLQVREAQVREVPRADLERPVVDRPQRVRQALYAAGIVRIERPPNGGGGS